jgi:DNA-binding beta-propeller fold protein YncE
VGHAGNLVIANPNARQVELVPAKTGTFFGQNMTAGHIYAVAGNGGPGPGGTGVPATKTGLNSPMGVAVDGAGNLVIADEGAAQLVGGTHHGSRVRVVAASTGTFYGVPMTAGDIYTVAGTVDGLGFSGDGGPAVQAAVIADDAGNVVIADLTDNRIRVVAARTGTFYGQQMTAGNIYTVAAPASGDSRRTARSRPRQRWTSQRACRSTGPAIC